LSTQLSDTKLERKSLETAVKDSLVSSPLPPPPSPEEGLVHTVCACAKYSVIFSVKAFVTSLFVCGRLY